MPRGLAALKQTEHVHPVCLVSTTCVQCPARPRASEDERLLALAAHYQAAFTPSEPA
jgi:hypothetical protein